jgi:TPR repeat protein
MDNVEIVQSAERLMDENRHDEAQALLHPLVILEVPAALFLAATFSLPENESEALFEARSIDYLTKAADGGYPPALYALGVCYDIGDLIAPDLDKAGQLFKQAAEAGHLKGKFCHGRNLFYGSNGMTQEREKGLDLIREAADGGVEEAAEFWAIREITPVR